MDTLIYSESEWVIGKYPEASYIESTRIISCKVLILYVSNIGGMLHIKDEQCLGLISEFIKELKITGLNFEEAKKLIAMKNFLVRYEEDKLLYGLMRQLKLPFEQIYLYIIPTGRKKHN